MVYNLLTCGGFAGAAKTSALSLVSGDCIKARLAFILLFFAVALLRKWGGEELGIDFNFWIALIASLVLYFIVIFFTGNVGISLLLGLVGAAIGGYGYGYLFGGGEGY